MNLSNLIFNEPIFVCLKEVSLICLTNMHFVFVFLCIVQPDKGVVQLMLGQHNSSVPISSYSPINLEVKGQSYYFTFTLKSMAVTSTAKGITAKQLLLGTVTDQV